MCFRVAGYTLPELWDLPVKDSLRVIEGVLDAPLEFLESSDTADECDARIEARVSDTEDRIKELVLQKAHIETGDGVVDRNQLVANSQPVPIARDIHSE